MSNHEWVIITPYHSATLMQFSDQSNTKQGGLNMTKKGGRCPIFISWLGASICLSVMLSPQLAVAASSTWTISDLGAVGHVGSAATGINNLGQITGYVFDKSSQAVAGCSTGSTACYAFKTDANGANLQLLTTGTTYSVAHGINNNGQIVGAQTVGGSGGSIGFVTATNGANYSTLANTRDVIALNDSGQLLISGVSNNPQLYLTGASGAGQVATFAGADIREGVAVNKSGQVLITGWSSISLTGPNGAGLTVLSSIPYTGQQQNFNSFGAGLNNLGQVLGDENDATYRGSFVTGPNGSGLTRVDAGGITVSATAINNNGAIVATGLLIDHGTVVGLNDLPAVKAAGWSYLNPTSINDNGLIVGSGTINGQTHAFLLTPAAVMSFSSAGISTSANSIVYGQSLAFTATVSGSMPTGSVQFVVDGANYGAPVQIRSDGTATLQTSNLAVGSHDVYVIYPGDANNKGSTSTHITESVTAPTKANITLSPSGQVSVVVNNTLVLKATVVGVSPTGAVHFTSEAGDLGTVQLSSGVATISLQNAVLGTYHINASYSGDSSNLANSATTTLYVVPVPPPDNDVPTLPQWGVILMGMLLLTAAASHRPKQM